MNEIKSATEQNVHHQALLANARISWDKKQKDFLDRGGGVLAPENGYEQYLALEQQGKLNGATLEQVVEKFNQERVSGQRITKSLERLGTKPDDDKDYSGMKAWANRQNE